MTQDEIKQKLTDNGLGSYIPAFEQNHLLDEDVLASMTDSDYVSIGVAILGDRKKLLLLFPQKKAESYQQKSSESENHHKKPAEPEYHQQEQTEPQKKDDEWIPIEKDGRNFVYRKEESNKFYCPKCHARVADDASLCSNCNSSLISSLSEATSSSSSTQVSSSSSVSAPMAISSTASTSAQTLPQSTESYFDGGVFQRLGWKILGALVTGMTFGICYPFAVCWLYDWEAKHTVIDGRRLKFTGTAGGLFGTWILCLLLSFVTCGIYALYIPIKLRRWREGNTFFEDEITSYDSVQKLKSQKASYFDGGFWQLFGWELLGWLVTVCTAGICYPWAVQMVYSWQQRHKVYCKKRCIFDGTAISLFGTWILCMFLAVVTCGIYTFWIPIKIKKWQIKHTHFADNLSDEEKSEIEKQTVKIDKKKAYKIGGIVAAVFAAIWLISFCVGRFSGTSVSAEKAVDYIYSLSRDATVKVKGEISEEELSYIFEAITDGNHKVDLDLSKTSGLKYFYSNYVKNLKSIKFSKDNEDIHGFYSEDLQNVELPEGVKRISGFENCRKIKSIYIPASVTEFYGFRGCTSLESIKVASGNPVYSGDGNCIFEKESGTLVLACKNSVIPKNVKKIGDGAFTGMKDLANIEIPDGVTEIGDKAFENCTALENVKISNSVEKIGRRAFAGCKKLSEITIPASTTKIEAGAFYECDGLKSAYFENPKNWKIYAQELWIRPEYLTGDYNISSSRLDEPSSAAKILQTPGKILLKNTKFADSNLDSGIDTEYSCWLQKD